MMKTQKKRLYDPEVEKKGIEKGIEQGMKQGTEKKKQKLY